MRTLHGSLTSIVGGWVQTECMSHPPIDQHDTGSWLYGALSEHDVLATTLPDYFRLDGSPSFRTDGIDRGEGSFPTRCELHSYEHARKFGYVGPALVLTSYQPGSRPEHENAMLLRDDTGAVVSVATYSYGRAYFEPGEPRTDPCAVCGAETLIPAQ